MSTPNEIVLFGGFNYKINPTEETIIPPVKPQFSQKKQEGPDCVINILNDVWVFEFKHMSWYRPIIGGKHPRRSFQYVMQTVSGEEGFKSVFISTQKKKNKIYELYSSGRPLPPNNPRSGNLVH